MNNMQNANQSKVLFPLAQMLRVMYTNPKGRSYQQMPNVPINYFGPTMQVRFFNSLIHFSRLSQL